VDEKDREKEALEEIKRFGQPWSFCTAIRNRGDEKHKRIFSKAERKKKRGKKERDRKCPIWSLSSSSEWGRLRGARVIRGILFARNEQR